MSDDLDPLLKRLHLANARRCWRQLVSTAEKERWTHHQLLLTLFAEEVAQRRGTRLAKSTRAAEFPFLRTIEEFDFSYQSTLRLTAIGSLLAPDFVTEGGSLILLGKPGRGKTHLAIAIAYRAIQNGFEALFVTAADLIDELSAASRQGNLRQALSRYLKPHVLVVDEVGYLSYGTDAANVLFHVVNERHIRKRAMVFTTNKNPKLWGRVLHDEDLADAIVDRILDRGRLLRLDGPSVRTKHLALDQVLEDDDPETCRRISGTTAAEFPEPTPDAATSERRTRARSLIVFMACLESEDSRRWAIATTRACAIRCVRTRPRVFCTAGLNGSDDGADQAIIDHCLSPEEPPSPDTTPGHAIGESSGSSPPEMDLRCADGEDNDGDGFVGCADWDCHHNALVSVCAAAPPVCGEQG